MKDLKRFHAQCFSKWFFMDRVRFVRCVIQGTNVSFAPCILSASKIASYPSWMHHSERNLRRMLRKTPNSVKDWVIIITFLNTFVFFSVNNYL